MLDTIMICLLILLAPIICYNAIIFVRVFLSLIAIVLMGIAGAVLWGWLKVMSFLTWGRLKNKITSYTKDIEHIFL